MQPRSESSFFSTNLKKSDDCEIIDWAVRQFLSLMLIKGAFILKLWNVIVFPTFRDASILDLDA